MLQRTIPPKKHLPMSDPRLTLMEAISRKLNVEAQYNGATIRFSPHLMFERHGDSLDRLVEVSERILPERLYPVKQRFDANRRFQWMWSRFPYRMDRISRRLGASWDIMQFGDLIPG